MPVADLSGAKRRIIERLKRADTATAPELATEFGLTDTAIRQHLEALEAAELVERSVAPAVGRGRPPVHWRLTEAATPLFADRHADLTVDLI
ncbi:MAG: MarR family transcriptional regulator, partial [Actinobacteria bacterium]|nr:MarR family transcriptional regulator [Actinomycetota bacterium]